MMMNKLALLFLSVVVAANAFVPQQVQHTRSVVALEAAGGYVPDGMTPAQYAKLKQKEEAEKKQKKFGAFGPQSFQSRSLQAFQQDLESGRTNHLMPVMNAKDRVKKGEIKVQDIPYMQRLGSWDNSDVKGAKKKEWSQTDNYWKENAQATPFRLDWSGNQQQRGGPKAAAAKPPQQQKTNAPPAKKKGLFGF